MEPSSIDKLKIDKLKSYSFLILKLPFNRAIYLTGSVASGRSNKDSDIDIIVLAENNRLYISKLITHLVLKILRLAQTDKTKKDRFSLEDFLDSSKFNFDKLEQGIMSAVKQKEYLYGITRVKTTETIDRLNNIKFIKKKRRIKSDIFNRFRLSQFINKKLNNILTRLDIYLQSRLENHYAKDSRNKNTNYNVKFTREQITIHPKDMFK